MADGKVTFRTRTLVLAVVGVIVVFLVVIAWVMVATRNDEVPVAAASPSASLPSVPSPSTVSPTETAGGSATGEEGPGGEGSGDGSGGGGGNGQADTAVRFASFSYVGEVDCAGWEGPGKAPLVVSWSGTNAVEAFWRGSDANVSSADGSNGYRAPVRGTQADLVVGDESRGVFQECGHREFYYVVVTLVGADGRTDSRTATFRDTSWGGAEP